MEENLLPSKTSSCFKVVKNEEKEGELKTHYKGDKYEVRHNLTSCVIFHLLSLLPFLHFIGSTSKGETMEQCKVHLVPLFYIFIMLEF